ncbi:MAG TPA: choice-of-anchor tandem repeat GloVer-containing protein, partial [Cyclobacteriaceae bacterium]
MIRFLFSVSLIITSSLSLRAQYSTLLDFTGAANGGEPLYTALISDGTFLYGMTSDGGAFTNGTVFKIKPDGTGFLKLHDFGSISLDGDQPFGSLYFDGTFLYGMTIRGGVNGQGTIFKVMPDGTGYLKIFDFVGSATGTDPYGALISDGTFLYGTAELSGANGVGTIFKIMPDGSGFDNIFDFSTPNGTFPLCDLVYDGTFLYGTTFGGGTNNGGVLFKIMPDGSGYSILKHFGTPDADTPYTGALILDGGFLYGMTELGGTADEGAIFKIKTDGTGYVKLHDFTIPDGGYGLGSLSFDGQFLYGLTQEGGPTDLGVLFKIKTDGTGFEKLMEFDGVTTGYDPFGTLLYENNTLYGMTLAGGTNDLGTIFKYSLANNFITQWNLATAGSGPTQLSFGTATSGLVNYTWQEISPGSATGSGSWSGTTLTITGLPAGATIRLQIAPTNFQRINASGTDDNRLILIEQWGTTAWTSMQNAFRGCTNLQITASDVPNLSGVTDMSSMFESCRNLNSPSNIGTWNTATVTNMTFMFYDAIIFNQDIGAWNTAAVTNMSTMFSDAPAFNQNIGSWNTAAVTNMSDMFGYATAFNQDIGSWNTAA